MAKIEIQRLDYHRNGITGEGFFVALFDSSETGPAVAITFPPEDDDDDRVMTAVLDLSSLVRGRPDAWRGYRYHDAMIEAIKTWRGDHA